MSTDGVGASFTCLRPRRTPATAVNPTTAPFTSVSLLTSYVRSRPSFADDHGRDFSISSASWHDAAYHNSARQVSLRLKREALDGGVGVASVAQYLDHARVCLAAFPALRWKTYCREQKALHSICMRVKGNKRAKKEDVVVAYGDGRFGSTMGGKRAAPVKKLRKHLRRYVTVVPVDESRMSRICSAHNEEQRE
ncbi:hypothetical protein V1519DRAFT_457184, partial [Lipomyces tetrasporus]